MVLIQPSRIPNREAIQLYREIMRNRILRESARREFEQARYETDPLVVARLLVVGRQCLNDTMRGLQETERKIARKIKETRSR